MRGSNLTSLRWLSYAADLSRPHADAWRARSVRPEADFKWRAQSSWLPSSLSNAVAVVTSTKAPPASPFEHRTTMHASLMPLELLAKCQCGLLSVNLPGPSSSVVACHCHDCQRRSGSPFGVLAYYADESVKITGEATRYERATATGGTFETFFCPTCGSTVYARAGRHPALIGIAVGAICDPTYPAPVRSVWEERKHDWVVIPEPVQHFPRGRS